MDPFIKELDEAIGKLCECEHKINQKAHDYGCGVLLHMSDIHMIEAIGNYPDSNITEIAGHLGFSKGTVSKLTKKLEKGGFIRRYQYKDNRKETFFSLTELGRKAYEGHYAFHETKSAHTHREYRRYSPEQRALILDFIRMYTDYLKDYI